VKLVHLVGFITKKNVRSLIRGHVGLLYCSLECWHSTEQWRRAVSRQNCPPTRRPEIADGRDVPYW